MKSLKQFKEQINEVLKKNTDISTWIHDFVHSDDPKFAGKSKEERIKMAKGAYCAKQNEEKSIEEGKMKELSIDLDDMDDKEFETKYKKSKEDTKKAFGGNNSPVKKATQSTTVTSKNEELVGKQKNIDLNKNGKIDSTDLKKLRGEDCWDGYKAIGLKDKDGKKVPNCVPEGFIDKNVAADLKNLDGASFAKKYNKTKSGYRKMGNVKAEEVSEGLGNTTSGHEGVHVTKKDALRVKTYVPPKKLATAPHKDRPVTAAKTIDTGVTTTIAAKGKPVTQDKNGKPVTQTMEKKPVTTSTVRSKKDDAMKEAAEVKDKKKEDLPFEPDPKPKKQAIAGKSGYGPSVARHLARLGMKGLKKEEVETIEEAVTRKHFQQVADLIKSHEDPKKRAELAHYHAGIFKGQNPRFDHNKFMAACDVKEGAMCEADEGKPGKMFAKIAAKAAKKYGSKEIGNKVAGAVRQKVLAKEETQIDEISKKTLGSYVKKASHDARMMGQIATDFENRADKARLQSRKDSNERLHKKYLERAWKRDTGISKAVDKLTKEEVQIDELNKSTLKSYVNKADKEADRYQQNYTKLRDIRDKTHGRFSDDTPELKHLDRKAVNRDNGVYTAKQKLAKEEQVDEAIAHPLPVKHAVDAVHATLGPKSATRFLSHLKPGIDKHTTWDKVNKALTAQGVQTRHIASIAQKTSHMNEENVEESRGHKILNTFFKNRETAQKAFNGNPAKDAAVAQGGGTPADQGIAAAKADAKKLNKEETMITYKELMAQLAEARYTIQDKREADEVKKASDPLAAYSEKKHPMTSPTSNVKKVAGKAYGGSNQKDDDETDEKPENKEKRGRGRPTGSKSGARRGGSKSEYRGLPTYSLNLPNKK